MKKIRIISIACWMIAPFALRAQDGWPKLMAAADGSAIRVYYPQADSFFDNNLQFHAAFSLTPKGLSKAIQRSYRPLDRRRSAASRDGYVYLHAGAAERPSVAAHRIGRASTFAGGH